MLLSFKTILFESEGTEKNCQQKLSQRVIQTFNLGNMEVNYSQKKCYRLKWLPETQYFIYKPSMVNNMSICDFN